MNHVICDLLDFHVMFQLVGTLRINYFVNLMNIKKLLCDFMRYNISSIILYPTQWKVLIKICQLLKVFNDTTNILSYN